MLRFSIRRGLRFIDRSARAWAVDRLLATNRVVLMDETGTIQTRYPEEIYKLWRNYELTIDPSSINNASVNAVYVTVQRDIHSYSPEEQALALSRYEFIKPLLDTIPISNRTLKEHCENTKLPCSTKPPSVRAVRRWIRCYRICRDITKLIPKQARRSIDDDPRLLDLFEQALENVYLTNQRVDKVTAIDELKRLIKEHNRDLVPEDHIHILSKATLYRRLKDLDVLITDHARYGRFEAMRMYRTALAKALARCVLDRIEIDHTRLDIILIDKTTGEVLGRPWLTIAIDVYSKMVYGYYLTFDPPSSNSVLQCILRGVLPKCDLREKYPDLINQWPTYGFPSTVVFDNSLDAHGKFVLDSLADMDVAFVQYCPSRVPWFKGNVERFFRTINCLIHSLPGTTFSNTKERAGYPAEKLAALDLETLDHAIVKWIIDVYHIRTQRTTKMPPLERWNTNAKGKDIFLPANVGSLQLLLGTLDSRSLFHYGVEFDKLKYNSPELQELYRQLQKHTQKKTAARKLHFKWYRDTVEYIDVLNPETDEYFRVTAVDREYAQGLNRPTHQTIQRQLRQKYGDQWRRDDQLKALADIRGYVTTAQSGKRKLTRQASKSVKDNPAGKSIGMTVDDAELISSTEEVLPDFEHPLLPVVTTRHAQGVAL